MAQPTARQRIERAFHVSFKTPEQAAELLNAYRDQVIAEAVSLVQALRQPINVNGDPAGFVADLLLAHAKNPTARTNQES